MEAQASARARLSSLALHAPSLPPHSYSLVLLLSYSLTLSFSYSLLPARSGLFLSLSLSAVQPFPVCIALIVFLSSLLISLFYLPFPIFQLLGTLFPSNTIAIQLSQAELLANLEEFRENLAQIQVSRRAPSTEKGYDRIVKLWIEQASVYPLHMIILIETKLYTSAWLARRNPNISVDERLL